jgi:hypothetical protein
MKPSSRDQFLVLLRASVVGRTLEKLTLGKPAGKDPTLKNIFVRPVTLKSGPRLAVVWRHKTRDVTKNFNAEEALALIDPMIGSDFLDAHLFTGKLSAQLETGSGSPSLRVKALQKEPASPSGNDRQKAHAIDARAPSSAESLRLR